MRTDGVEYMLADPVDVAAVDADGGALAEVPMLLDAVPQPLMDAEGVGDCTLLDELHADADGVTLPDTRGDDDTLCEDVREGVLDGVREIKALALPLVDAPTDRVGVRVLKSDGDDEAVVH